MLSKPFPFLLTLVLLVTSAPLAAERPPLINDPAPAPSFTLEDMDGKTYKLEDYKGQVVVVNFWASWCPPCREEMPSMERAWKQLQEEDIAMLAINVGEDADTIFTFTADYPVSFPLPMDQDSTVINEWPIQGLPTTFVLDKQGRIVYRVVGGREWDDPELIDMLIELQNQ
ncbi:TlpA family protein disulfide reductase [Thiohalophilus thiocyanatoxydans]|uniref:Peroxiredoxin n=1 Tax=Thiohalophilus thiocyanatoxydans TaxID=381308 RepID=A0A4R8IPG8_9GAMM|nr:TlpA disulfide reductase family protein [Thiohalophilus thiocyanatoxydans]TDY02822.1 peroxiredoxin [Thiohalophilus thiocyanatoxydans]